MIAPKLRFSEFKDEWIESKIGENFNVTSGTTPLRSEQSYFANPSIYWVKTTDLNNGIIKSTEEKISKIALAKTSLKILPKNTVFVAMYGGFNQIGRTGILSVEATCNQALSAIYPNENFNPYFVLTYLNHKVDDWKNFAASSRKDPNITKNDVLSFPIIYPTLTEQTKIAEFLSTVDDKISQLSRQLALLNQYKKGVMQKIFSQEIRFKNDNGEDFGEWDYLQLDEVLDYEQPTKYIVESTEYDDIYQTPVLTAGKSFILGYTNETNGIFEAKKENVIIFDDFTTAYKFVDFDFKVKSSAMKILKVKNENFDIRYIYATFSLLQLPLGDEHKRRWISEYSLQEVPVPSIQEQEKIAEFLTAIDERIDHTTTQLNHTKQWKKGLLQQMFV